MATRRPSGIILPPRRVSIRQTPITPLTTISPIRPPVRPLVLPTVSPVVQPAKLTVTQPSPTPSGLIVVPTVPSQLPKPTVQPITEPTVRMADSSKLLTPARTFYQPPVRPIVSPLIPSVHPTGSSVLTPPSTIPPVTQVIKEEKIEPMRLAPLTPVPVPVTSPGLQVREETKLEEFIPPKPVEVGGRKWQTFKRDDLFVFPDDPQTHYRRRADESKTSVHWGQRKLALTTLAMINLYWSPDQTRNPIIVYAGAAPGRNLNFIISLYPQIEWHLYDPHPVGFKVPAGPQVHTYKQLFTDETARMWTGKGVFFISDIRTVDITKVKGQENIERGVWNDMQQQQQWVKIIKPIAAMLKFRLPYTNIKFSDQIDHTKGFAPYLAGLVLKQPWAAQTSTETRLLVTFDSMINGVYPVHNWNLHTYEDQLFHHNSVVRETISFFNPFYLKDPTKQKSPIMPPELNNSWDDTAELTILNDYLIKVQATGNLLQMIQGLSKLLTIELSKGKPDTLTLSFLRRHPRYFKRHFRPEEGDEI